MFRQLEQRLIQKYAEEIFNKLNQKTQHPSYSHSVPSSSSSSATTVISNPSHHRHDPPPPRKRFTQQRS